MARWTQALGSQQLRYLAFLACSLGLVQSATAERALPRPALLQDDAQAPMCLLQRTSAAAARSVPGGHRSAETVTSMDSVKWPAFNEDAATPARKEELHAPLPRPVKRQEPAQQPAHDDLRDTLKALLEHQISAIRSKSSASSNEKFVREDELLRFQDDRLRQQDAELRQENQRLQLALAQLSAANRSDAKLDVGSLVTSLLASDMGDPQETTRRPLPLNTSNTSYMNGDTDKTKMNPHQGRMALFCVLGGIAAFILYVVYHLHHFFYVMGGESDKDGDGDVDMLDFREYMAQNICCGVGYETAKKISFVIFMAALGFAFLWWQGIIQPFLKELVCYIYLGTVLVLLVGLVLAEMLSKFGETFQRVSHMMEQFTQLMHLNKAQALADVMHKAGA